MPNGEKTTRDYVIETHTEVKNLKEGFEEHKKNHKFLWIVVIGLPPAFFYVIKLLEAIK